MPKYQIQIKINNYKTAIIQEIQTSIIVIIIINKVKITIPFLLSIYQNKSTQKKCN